MERIIDEKGIVLRHTWVERLEHWAFALSGSVLVFSGLGELPMYRRFMVTEIPGFKWAGDYLLHLKIHYLAAVVFVSVMVFHALYHGWLGHRGLLPRKGDFTASVKTVLSMFGWGEEPKADKYLPEQRLAYAYLAGVAMILAITGIFKVLKNLPGAYFPPGFITTITLFHTFATFFFLLGILAHLAALLLKVNRPMVKPIFTGKMELEYARRRHPLWYERLAARFPAAEKSAVLELSIDQKKEEIREPAAIEAKGEGIKGKGPEGTPPKEGIGQEESKETKENQTRNADPL